MSYKRQGVIKQFNMLTQTKKVEMGKIIKKRKKEEREKNNPPPPKKKKKKKKNTQLIRNLKAAKRTIIRLRA